MQLFDLSMKHLIASFLTQMSILISVYSNLSSSALVSETVHSTIFFIFFHIEMCIKKISISSFSAGRTWSEAALKKAQVMYLSAEMY